MMAERGLNSGALQETKTSAANGRFAVFPDFDPAATEVRRSIATGVYRRCEIFANVEVNIG